MMKGFVGLKQRILATEEDGKEMGELKSRRTSEVATAITFEIMRA